MERLTQPQLRAALDFLREAYRFGNLEEFVARVVKGLPGLIPAEIVACCDMNPAKNLSRNFTDPVEFSSEKVNRLWKLHMREHPQLQRIARGGSGRAARFADLVPRHQFRRTGLYNEFYRAIGVEGCLCFTVDVPRPRVVGIALHRERWNFREEDRALAEALRPHLVQAWRNAKAVSRIQSEVSLLSRTIEQLDRGVIVLDRLGRVRLMTKRAERLLTEWFDWHGSADGRLPERLCFWIRHQMSLVDSTGSLGPRFPLVMERDGKRIEIGLTRDSEQTLLLFHECAGIVAPKGLTALGVTRREAEVLAWVAQGKTNSEIGTILCMSTRTVQKHLEHIFQKLGVETRTTAARVALEASRMA